MQKLKNTIWLILILLVGSVIFTYRLLKTFKHPTLTFAERVELLKKYEH